MRTSATRPEPPVRAAKARPARARSPALAFAVQYGVARTGLPSAASLKRWASAALERDVAATLRFVGLAEGRTLNAVYRGKDDATNVLTFVYDDAVPLAGDIVLCAPVVAREAAEQAITLEAHYCHLVVHGVLHLQGFDHIEEDEAEAMEARETQIVTSLGYDDPYRLDKE